MSVPVSDIVQLLSNLSTGLSGANAVKMEGKPRLITYSKHSRARRSREDAQKNFRATTKTITTFFRHSAAWKASSQVASMRVPSLTAMCLFTMEKELGSSEEYSEAEIRELYECIPSQHRRELPPHPNISRAFLNAIIMQSLDHITFSLVMLIFFRKSPYLENWHPFSHALLEALDGYHGPHSTDFLSTSEPIATYAAEVMADIILDLMVTAEIERRRDPTRKSQTPFLQKLLTRLAFHVYQIGGQRILPNIFVPAEPDCFEDLGEQHAVSNISSPTEDDSFDELDFLHVTGRSRKTVLDEVYGTSSAGKLGFRSSAVKIVRKY
ncbi:hypothetical protein B0H14DRAFT_3599358 [Mycena olivaceomarginata]|nr:hypothetical protein B0H14DRAFT_3599358 [Mycena olivaceomarginata]